MKLVRALTSDLISELPDNIIETILQYLPIQDAVRTSLLSRKWRYKWVTLSSLTFDERNIQFSSHYPAVNKVYKVLNFIDRVLMLHVSPIEKFKLYISGRANCTSIDQHILFLSKHSIREFILNMFSSKYVVPSCLFSCQQLSCLELHCCIFKCLSANKGFSTLKRLHLEDITFGGNDQFESLISCSPLLEMLLVSDFKNVTHPKIHVPNLKSLVLDGSFKSICFVNTAHLASMSITLFDIDKGAKQVEQGLACNLIEVLGDLRGIEKLCIQGYFLVVRRFLSRLFEVIIIGKCLLIILPFFSYLFVFVFFLVASIWLEEMYESLPTIYFHLKKLIFELTFNSLDEFSAALCLIRNAPHLEELETTLR